MYGYVTATSCCHCHYTWSGAWSHHDKEAGFLHRIDSCFKSNIDFISCLFVLFGQSYSKFKPSKMLSNSKLASIAWNDTNQVTQYRLYSQDSKSEIRESAWNSTGKQWYSNGVVGKAKSGSAIAAAVTGPPSWPFQINLYWINEAGNIDEWYTTDGVTWQSGGLLSSNISPSSISALSTIWHRAPNCPLCPNTRLLVYQDTSNKFNLGNASTDGWNWTVLNANPIPGSGAAFTLTQEPADVISGIQLFYQTASGNLVSNDWSDPPADGTAGQ